MSAIVEFFRPTLYKLIFTIEWLVYVLLTLVERHPLDLDLPPFALWSLLFYVGGCALVAWSRRTDRVASGWGLVVLIVAMVAVDQLSKAIAVATLQPGASIPLVEGWLHFSNVQNTSGSWLGPGWLKPILAMVAVLVLPLSVVVYRYYVSTRRRSLWADLTFVGVSAGYASWLAEILVRGYIVDVIRIPGLISFDLKDLFLSLGVCVGIEVLDNPTISLRPEGWRAEIESTRRLVVDLAAFAAGEARSCWAAIVHRLKSPPENG
jgi:signal peptidase II